MISDVGVSPSGPTIQVGCKPSVRAFLDPPLPAMLARLPAGREVNLAPASFAFHAAAAEPGIVARLTPDQELLLLPRSAHLLAQLARGRSR